MRMIWPSVDIDNDRMGVEAQPTRLRVSTTGSVFINEERPQGQAEIIRSRELLPCEEVAMVREAEVTCVSKTDHTEPYDRIRSLGGGTGPYWEISHARAIDLVEHDRLRFYTCTPQGERLYLVVVTSRDGYKYIKTVADEVVPGHLLELPDCPGRLAGAIATRLPHPVSGPDASGHTPEVSNASSPSLPQATSTAPPPHTG
jgi:hypothetical protein